MTFHLLLLPAGAVTRSLLLALGSPTKNQEDAVLDSSAKGQRATKDDETLF